MANLWLTAVSLPMQEGGTALHFSATEGHALVVEILLDAGADRDIQNKVNIFDLFAHTCVYDPDHKKMTITATSFVDGYEKERACRVSRRDSRSELSPFTSKPTICNLNDLFYIG